MSSLTADTNLENKISYTRKYMLYAAAIFGITNLLDIFSSNAGPLVRSYVITEFFTSQGATEAQALQTLGLITTLGMPLMLLAFSLRTVADKFGRKPALIINIVGMTIGAGFILFSSGFTSFVIGTLFGNFFLTADIQLLMITEESPKDKRASFLAFARVIGLIGAMGVPLMQDLFLNETGSNWRVIYYLPLIMGVVVSFLVLFTLKESSVYLTMKMKQEESGVPKKQRQKGLFKQAIKIKGFKILFLTTLVGILGTLGGMAEREFMQPFLVDNFPGQVTLIYYLRYAISIVLGLIMGVIRDKIGRKIGLITTLVIQCIFMGLFFLFVELGNAWLTGLSYGLFIYAIFMNSVTAGLITNELTPTKIRGTMGIVLGLLSFGFILVWTVLQSLLAGMGIAKGTLMLIATIPFSILGIIIAIYKVPETKGTDLTALDDKLISHSIGANKRNV